MSLPTRAQAFTGKLKAWGMLAARYIRGVERQLNAVSFGRCGLVVKRDARDVKATLQAVLDCLGGLGVPVVADLDTARTLAPGLTAVPLAELSAHCDLVIVIGGDGTLLRACRAVVPDGCPLLGINLGRLGFMVDIAPGAIHEVLPEILAGRHVEEKRFVMEAEQNRPESDVGLGLAINDVVIRHPEPVSMLEFATYADGHLISHHRADGLIISTPTGSTAYALSAGGPMMHPASDSLAVVPICPHTLSDRPLVLPASTTIRVEVNGRDGRGAIVTLDGYHNTTLARGESLTVRRASSLLKLIHPADYDWYGILRSKLNWGREKPAFQTE